MQKTLIVMLLVVVVALVGVVVYQKLNPAETTPIVASQPVVNQPVVNPPVNNQPSTSCAKEGEEQIATAALYKSCCSGLTSVGKVSDYDANCNLTPDAKIANRLNSVCTACGNGVCGKGENQCNCPADCSQSFAVNLISTTPYKNSISDQSITVKFNKDVDIKTITKQNIHLCAVSVSAGSSGQRSCETDPGNPLGFSYNGTDKTLLMQPNFIVSCAACVWELEFTNGLKDLSGDSLKISPTIFSVSFSSGQY